MSMREGERDRETEIHTQSEISAYTASPARRHIHEREGERDSESQRETERHTERDISVLQEAISMRERKSERDQPI